MSIQESQGTSYMEMAQGWTNYGCTKAKELWSTAQEKGNVRNSVTSATRSIVGIYATKNFPGTAVAGAVAANIAPEKVKYITDTMEGAITGLWKKLSVNQKVLLAAAGIACVTFCDPTMVFTTLGTAFAFKLGSELALRNRVKEMRMEAETEATRDLPDPDKMN
jgi:hypothetical protein